MIDLTRAMYAVFLHSLGQCCKFLRRKPSVEFAFYLAKASFLQDMLLCLFVFYLAKASFLQDMLLGMFVCFLAHLS
jgi:hypothetical protein